MATTPVRVAYLQGLNALQAAPSRVPAPGTRVVRTETIAGTPDGVSQLVTKERSGTLDVLPTTSARGGLVAGPPVLVAAGDHPTGLAVSPDLGTLVVTNANNDTVGTFAYTRGLPGLATTLTVRPHPTDPSGSADPGRQRRRQQRRQLPGPGRPRHRQP